MFLIYFLDDILVLQSGNWLECSTYLKVRTSILYPIKEILKEQETKKNLESNNLLNIPKEDNVPSFVRLVFVFGYFF